MQRSRDRDKPKTLKLISLKLPKLKFHSKPKTYSAGIQCKITGGPPLRIWNLGTRVL